MLRAPSVVVVVLIDVSKVRSRYTLSVVSYLVATKLHAVRKAE